MVPERYNVRARSVKTLGKCARDAHAGGVFAVDHDKIAFKAFPQLAQMLFEDFYAGLSDHVSHSKYIQTNSSV
jgi:hypothetical protein